MGDWTTVNIIGSCAENEVAALKAEVDIGENYNKFHSLCNTGGLCGLGSWPAKKMFVSGNLAERGYDADDVADTLTELVKVAPSLDLKVHIGDHHESTKCIKTVTVKDGVVTLGDPEVDELVEQPQDVVNGRLLKALFRPL
jgi:hypothetical protein